MHAHIPIYSPGTQPSSSGPTKYVWKTPRMHACIHPSIESARNKQRDKQRNRAGLLDPVCFGFITYRHQTLYVLCTLRTLPHKHTNTHTHKYIHKLELSAVRNPLAATCPPGPPSDPVADNSRLLRSSYLRTLPWCGVAANPACRAPTLSIMAAVCGFRALFS